MKYKVGDVLETTKGEITVSFIKSPELQDEEDYEFYGFYYDVLKDISVKPSEVIGVKK